MTVLLQVLAILFGIGIAVNLTGFLVRKIGGEQAHDKVMGWIVGSLIVGMLGFYVVYSCVSPSPCANDPDCIRGPRGWEYR